MRLTTRLMIGCLLLAGLVGSAGFSIATQTVKAVGNSAGDKAQDRVLRARAIVRGAPGSGIVGVVKFKERPGNDPEPGVDVIARVGGPAVFLRPGRHGMHIHEVGRCDPPFESAGGHFDPGPFGNSTPVDLNHPFHMGDIPNLLVVGIGPFGLGYLQHQTSRITLSPGPLSVFDADGSAVLVHLNPDRGEPGVEGASGGPRIACGIIELISGEEGEDDNN